MTRAVAGADTPCLSNHRVIEGHRLKLLVVLALFAFAWPARAADAPVPTPTLFVDPKADSMAGSDAPSAPLLIPGRKYAPDTLHKSSAQVAQDFFRRGKKLEADGNPQAAMAAYRSAAGLDPTIPSLYFRMGQIYDAFGAAPEALQAYAAEVQRHPENRVAARHLGLSLARVGESERAIQQLELLVRNNTRDGASWRALGFAYTHAKRFKDAERALRNAIAVPPAEAEEYRDLGVLLANQPGRETEARAAYTKAATLDPKDGTVFINLGNLEMRAGRPDAALAAYARAETRDSTSTATYRAQTNALIALGRTSEMADVYRRWLRRAPDDESARLEAVGHFVAQGRTDVALGLAREGVQRAPKSATTHNALGVAQAASGDPRSAHASFRRAEAFAGRNDPDGLAQARALIADLRAGASDSLRAVFAADSVVAARGAARRDSTLRAGPGAPGSR